MPWKHKPQGVILLRSVPPTGGAAGAQDLLCASQHPAGSGLPLGSGAKIRPEIYPLTWVQASGAAIGTAGAQPCWHASCPMPWCLADSLPWEQGKVRAHGAGEAEAQGCTLCWGSLARLGSEALSRDRAWCCLRGAFAPCGPGLGRGLAAHVCQESQAQSLDGGIPPSAALGFCPGWI